MAEYSHLIDYIKNEKRTLAEQPFSEADGMVLAELVYIHFENIVHRPSLLSVPMPLKNLAVQERLEVMLNGVSSRGVLSRLIYAAAESPRFRTMKLNFAEGLFSVEEERQFAAVTYFLDDGSAFVAFRGTDNTITGWRENFNMAYKKVVPAQANSVDYLERVAQLTRRTLRVGGHSKGGNLAVYAAMSCREKVQNRIAGVYSYDGPGFKETVFSRPEYMRIKERIHRLMPEGSLIGTLLNQSTDYKVVKSDGEGFKQHNMCNWRFDGTELVFTGKLTDDAVRFDRMLDSWVASLSDRQLENAVGIIFDLIKETGAESFDKVLKYLNSGELTAVKAIKMIGPEKCGQAAYIIAALGRAYLKTRRTARK